uniref:Uncharacterized protein n=1 Tax=Ciona savignyi TaxID=51511 RepID=H2Y7I3_CIOSA
MGTTCSKKKSVAVENTSIKIDHVQVEEIVGPTGNSPQNTLEDILQLPNAISCDDITVGESEPITRYDERKNSTGASTLIFPSYSGYRSFDGFGKGITRRTSGSHWAPTARVTPIQATPTIATPELVRNAAVELFERRGSPRVTRYSAMLTPNLPRRYDHHTEAKESSIEDDDFFGSDLESLDRELPIVLKNDDLASTRSIYSHAQIQPLTTLEEKNPNSPKQRRANAVNTDQREIYIEV